MPDPLTFSQLYTYLIAKIKDIEDAYNQRAARLTDDLNKTYKQLDHVISICNSRYCSSCGEKHAWYTICPPAEARSGTPHQKLIMQEQEKQIAQLKNLISRMSSAKSNWGHLQKEIIEALPEE